MNLKSRMEFGHQVGHITIRKLSGNFENQENVKFISKRTLVYWLELGVSSLLHYSFAVRFGCEDKRFKIRLKGENDTVFVYESACQWNGLYDIDPMDLECVLTYCMNATTAVNFTNNFDVKWEPDERLLLGRTLNYPCQQGMKIENNTFTKLDADDSIDILCGQDGYFKDPEIWPMCSDDISCGDPPHKPELGSRFWLVGANGSTSYQTVVQYE